MEFTNKEKKVLLNSVTFYNDYIISELLKCFRSCKSKHDYSDFLVFINNHEQDLSNLDFFINLFGG